MKEERNGDCIERRVARLERENRFLKGAGLAVLVAGGSILAMSFGGGDAGEGGMGQFKQVDTGHLVLRDNDGQMRAWLGIAEGGPRIVFFDASGQQRMGVGMTRQGEPALGIFDVGQNPRVVIGMMEGWPGVVLRDPQGKKRVAIYSRDEWSSMFFYDRREVKRAGIGHYGEGAAVNLCDERGDDRTGLTTDRNGSSLSFFDVGKQKRAGLGLLEKDQPALGFFSHEADPLLSMTGEDDEPAINLYGTNHIEIAISVTRSNAALLEMFGPERVLKWKAP